MSQKVFAVFFVAATVFSFAPRSFAGFVDQRAVAADPAASGAASAVSRGQPVPAIASSPAPAAVAKGQVEGYLPVAGWDQPAPDVTKFKGLSPGMAAPYIAFGDAIFRLIPEGHPPVVLDGPRSLLTAQVTWDAGLTRRAALDQIAAEGGLEIRFTGSKPGSALVVSRVRTGDMVQATVVPIAAAAVPATASLPTASDSMAVALAKPGSTGTRSEVQSPSAAPSVKPAPVSATSAPAPGTAVVAAAAPAAPVSMNRAPVNRTFEIRLSDVRLSNAFARWASEGNVRIRWDADNHVLIDAADSFAAPNVMEAVVRALRTPGVANSGYPLEACEYPNTPPLIRVTRRGEQSDTCPQ